MKNCIKCNGQCSPSKMYVNKLKSFDDFGNDAGQSGTTQARVGEAVLIECLKCEDCGHSFVPEINHNFILVYQNESTTKVAFLNKISNDMLIHFDKIVEILPLNRRNLEYVESTYPNIEDSTLIKKGHMHLTAKQDSAIRAMLKWYPRPESPVGFNVEVIKVLENFTETEISDKNVISEKDLALNAYITKFPKSTVKEQKAFILGYQTYQNFK